MRHAEEDLLSCSEVTVAELYAGLREPEAPPEASQIGALVGLKTGVFHRYSGWPARV